MRYVIKCDDCKAEIGQTDALPESAAGGRCQDCKTATARHLAQVEARRVRKLARLTAAGYTVTEL